MQSRADALCRRLFAGRLPRAIGRRDGKERYLRFLQDAHEHDWNHAIRTWYGLPDVASLERRWSNWVTAGSPEIRDNDNRQIAQADAQAMRKKGILVRSQSPDDAASVRRPQSAKRPNSRIGPFPRSDEPQAPSIRSLAGVAAGDADGREQRHGRASHRRDARSTNSVGRPAPRRSGAVAPGRMASHCPLAQIRRDAIATPAAVAAEQTNSDRPARGRIAARRRFRTAKERHAQDDGGRPRQLCQSHRRSKARGQRRRSGPRSNPLSRSRIDRFADRSRNF